MTFYATASGAGWIVPKKYVEKVGDDGFKKAPIGAGPYKFVSFNPGVELVLEAFEGYWRKTPAVKRLVMKVIPDEATRLAALKRGEVDIAYSIRGELAEESAQARPGLTLEAGRAAGAELALFPRAVGPEIAVARSARAPGGQSGDRPRRDEQGAVSRLLQDHQQHRPRHVSITTGSRRPRFTIRTRPRNCWPRPAIPTASTPGCCIATAPTPTWARRSSTTSGRSASRVKLQPIERAGFLRRLCRQEIREGHYPGRQRRLWQRGDPAGVVRRQGRRLMPMAAIPISTSCSRSRRTSSIRKSARRSSTRCSSWSTTRRSTRRSGSSVFSTGSGRGSGESSFGLIPGFAYTAPFEDITIKGA